VLGWVYELNRDVPDHDALKALKEEDWGRGQMPVGPVVATMGVDVQGDGVYLEVVGHGPTPKPGSWTPASSPARPTCRCRAPGPTSTPMPSAG
jgi:hypothetical protein